MNRGDAVIHEESNGRCAVLIKNICMNGNVAFLGYYPSKEEAQTIADRYNGVAKNK